MIVIPAIPDIAGKNAGENVGNGSPKQKTIWSGNRHALCLILYFAMLRSDVSRET